MKSMSRVELARRGGGVAALSVALAMTMGACGVDKQKIPALGGPSELSIAIKLTASPDVLTADGFSTALVQVQVFDQNGQTVAGRAVLLALSNSDLQFADLGTLYSPSGSLLRAAEATVVTGANGVATAIYTAPPRTDFTADGRVTIQARLVGTDFNGTPSHFIAIELKSAEPRLFAGTTGCGFVVEAPRNAVTCSGSSGSQSCTVKVGSQVLFQSTAAGVRFTWFWGDGTPSGDGLNENHPFRTVGQFTVTQLVTAASGAQAACTAEIDVVP